MFLGAILGFAICTRITFDKIARNDGTVHPDQALLPFLGVMAGGCIGAVAGALLIRFLFAVYTFGRGTPPVDRRAAKNDKDSAGE